MLCQFASQIREEVETEKLCLGEKRRRDLQQRLGRRDPHCVTAKARRKERKERKYPSESSSGQFFSMIEC